MSSGDRQRGFLLEMAVEGLGESAGQLAEHVLATGERAVTHFGPPVLSTWQEWFQSQPNDRRAGALAELADIPTDRARRRAADAIRSIAPTLDGSAYDLLLSWIGTLPRAVQRAMIPDPYTGGMSLKADQSPDDPGVLLSLLPVDAPPYLTGDELPGTRYQLERLLRTHSTGPGYRASHHAFVELCMDRQLLTRMREQEPALRTMLKLSHQLESSTRLSLWLEMDLSHPTPYLIHQYQTGVDLPGMIAAERQHSSVGIDEDEILRLIAQMAQGLAVIHELGHAYACLMPTHIRIHNEELLLTRFGLGPVLTEHALTHSRIGTVEATELSLIDQIQLQAGAGARLYLSPEVIAGAVPSPADDIYALGVIWYQLCISDFTVPLSSQWKEELQSRQAFSSERLEILSCCLAPGSARLQAAGKLIELLEATGDAQAATITTSSTAMTAEEVRESILRREKFFLDTRALLNAHRHQINLRKNAGQATLKGMLFGTLLLIAAVAMLLTGASAFLWLPWLILAAIAVTYVCHHKLKAKREAGKLSEQIRSLADTYPEEAQNWGGAGMLANIELVREMVATLQTDMGIPTMP